MGAKLDLSKAHLTRQHGDLLAVYTWVNDERALVLLPAYRKNASWYIVLDSAAYKYDDPAYMARQCRVAAEVLGLEDSRANWFRIAKIINEGLPDLIEMPPAPEPEIMRASLGEIKMFEHGQLVCGEDFKLEVDAGAHYG